MLSDTLIEAERVSSTAAEQTPTVQLLRTLWSGDIGSDH
jgi:hypothetical protein